MKVLSRDRVFNKLAKILEDGSKSVRVPLRDLEKLMANVEQSRNDQDTLAVSKRKMRKAEESGCAEIEI